MSLFSLVYHNNMSQFDYKLRKKVWIKETTLDLKEGWNLISDGDYLF